MSCRVLPLLIVLFLSCTPAWGRLNPDLQWQTVETEHFVVLFHLGGNELAEHAAAIAEETHGELSRELRWSPQEKTRLILADVSDSPNAMASPFPFNRIILYLAPPLEQPFALTDREEWLRIAIVHEYTHILHLDAVHDLPAGLRAIFGRLYFPNAWQPAWLIEGLATYEETRLTRGGRGRSSYRNMLLSRAVREGRFPALADAGVIPDSWPQGEVPYLFGEAFYQQLVARYGSAFPGTYAEAYASRTLPFFINDTTLQTIGATFADEWRIWQSQLHRQLGPQPELPADNRDMLTATGYRKGGATLSPDGSLLVFTADSADHVPMLYLRRADGTIRPLARRLAIPAGEGVAWLPDGKSFIYAALSLDPRDNLFGDLYRYDLTTGTATRLTHGLRAGAPDRHPVTGELLFSVTTAGATRIMVSDPDGRHPRPLTAPGTYARPRWSPDGTRIAVVVKDGGQFHLRLLDRNGTTIEEISAGDGLLSAPAWSPEGTVLYFVSDRDGTSQIYAWRVSDRSLWQVSRDAAGLFAPEPSRDGSSLIAIAYSAQGFDLARLPLQPEKWQPLPPPATPPAVTAPPPAPQLPTAPYRPWSDLRPRYWLPWFSSDEEGGAFGLLTSGEDAVARHVWSATLLYGAESHHPAGSLLYRYDGWLPTLDLTAHDLAIPYGDFYPVNNRETYWEHQRRVGADLTFPGGTLWQRHAFVAGVRYQFFDPRLPPPPGYLAPPGGERAGLRLAWLFNSTVRPTRAISPEDGRRVEVAVEHDSPFLGSTERSSALLDWHEFVTFTRHRVLATRLFAAAASGDLLPQRAFQLGGDPPGDLGIESDPLYVPLRGYPPNSQRGERAFLASLEYRVPLREVAAGTDNGAFYLRRLHGALFTEAGATCDTGLPSDNDLRRALGAELRLDLDAGYALPLTLRLVLAKGLDQGGEAQGYVSAWLRF